MRLNHKELQKGQGLVEYALILVMVSVVTIAAISILGDSVDSAYCQVAQALDSTVDCVEAEAGESDSAEAEPEAEDPYVCRYTNYAAFHRYEWYQRDAEGNWTRPHYGNDPDAHPYEEECAFKPF
jgi:pilus assembly protein Flp/PilA